MGPRRQEAARLIAAPASVVNRDRRTRAGKDETDGQKSAPVE